MIDDLTYDAVLRRDPCAYCGETGGTLDHVVATSRGGANHWSNLSGACGVCNGLKGNRSLLVFLVHRDPPTTVSAKRLQQRERSRQQWAAKQNWEHRFAYATNR